nr:odorant binding protein 10 [Graphosoma rubrolineatum]
MEILKLLAVIFVFPACIAEEKTDAKLISKIMKHVGECAIDSNVDFDLCFELYETKAKDDDPKYNPCKCLISCVSKKMNVMSEEGKFKEDESLKIINSLKTPGYKEEALKVYEMCKNPDGTDCVAGFNKMKCVITNSEKARNLTMQLVKTMQGKA